MGAVMSYVSIIVNMVAGLLYTPWMIHSIGKENFGLYILAMSVIQLFLFDFGLSVSINRFLSKYLAEGRQDKANNCLGLVYRLYLILDLVLLIALTTVFIFIPDIYKELSPIELGKFKVVFVIAAIFAVFSFPFIPVNGVLSAHEKFFQMKLCEVIHKFIVVVCMTTCLLSGMGLYALVGVNAFAGVTMILIKLCFIQKYTEQKIHFGYWDKIQFKQIVGFSGWVSIMSLCQRSIFHLGPTIIGAFSGSAAIAIFGIANTLESYVFSFSSAISGLFLPSVSRLVAKGDDVLPLMIRIGRLQLILVSLIVLGFCCVGYPFIQLWLGEDFSEAYLCTVLIIIPSLLQLPQEIGDQTLYAKNKVKQRAYAFMSMAVANIVIGIPLTHYYGAKGLCISISIAYLIRTIVLDILYKRILHIDISKFFYDTFIKFLPSFTIVVILGILIGFFFPANGWLGFLSKCALFVIMYSTVVYRLALNTDEKNLIAITLRKFSNKILGK